MYEYLELLLYIAKKEGLFGSLETSTLRISKELGIPQQTISRKLREMEAKSLIKRLATPSGITLSLADNGRELLKNNYQELSSIFKTKKTSISADVQSGIGEGAYYVSQQEYQKQFQDKLGFYAYPGTLNLKLKREELAQLLADKEKIIIKGFTTKSRTFGSITSYKLKMNNSEAAIVVPERTRHSEDIIEVIAPVNLRDSLKLKDNDKVKLS
ncbi:MAG: DUF120 domain-containing protein [Nanoarchaeota archaeon]|nr:DUF120 domain-containing protein [Nanoarchaeota archaeon]